LKKLVDESEFKLAILQQTAVEEVSEVLQRNVEQKSKAALLWITDCETAAATGMDEEELLAKLRTPPPFLGEAQQRLEVLESELTRRIASKREETSSMARLNSISAKGSVSELNELTSVVKAITCITPLLKKSVDEKLTAIEKELNRLKSFSTALWARLDNALAVPQVDEIQSDVLRHQSLFDDNEENSKLQRALQRCRQLRELFDRVSECTKGPIQSPADAKMKTDRLKDIGKSMDMWLSDGHRAILSEAVAGVGRHILLKTDEAMGWLDNCESELSNGSDPIQLLDRLKRPSAFLPDEGRKRLTDLIGRISRRIDDDEVLLVIKHFKTITNMPKRVECLDRLKAMVDES
jgi:hypothetical protein